MFNLSKLTKRGHDNDEKLIGHIKDLYENVTNNHYRLQDALKLLTNQVESFSRGETQVES